MKSTGHIELICGPMFSGKTTALIERVAAARVAGRSAAVFKPALDTRYGAGHVVSHDQRRIDATSIRDAAELLTCDGGVQVVAIDELHFFEQPIVAACRTLAGRGHRLIVAGVELDHRGQPFESVAGVAAVADVLTRLVARCARCGAAARHSQRLIASSDRIVVGGVGEYEPRCDQCFEPSP